jgi:mevalonate kinase
VAKKENVLKKLAYEMSKIKKTYKAKMLLFGEYSVINGSDALAMPTGLFSGTWDFNREEAKSQDILYDFHAYLCGLEFEKANYLQSSFKEDLDQGLVFNSSIPIGYGVGSSGAVCAAIFDQYYQKDSTIDRLTLKNILGRMENFFHGSSSGLDPLICYLDQAILIQRGELEVLELPENNSAYHFFLLDTGIPRRTAPLVQLYLEKYQSDKEFQKLIEEKLSAFNNLAIRQYLDGEYEALFHTFHEISDFQRVYFKEMIPENCRGVWQQGLDTDLFKIKLCGAGGGGFLMGMTNDLAQATLLFRGNGVLKIRAL